jgi:hypothetical protein
MIITAILFYNIIKKSLFYQKKCDFYRVIKKLRFH